MTEVDIRKANFADSAAILDLATAFYATDGYTTPPEALPGYVDDILGEERSVVFVADSSEQGVIGFVTVLLSRGLEFGVTANLEALYVRSKVRGQRIGTRLMEAALYWAKDQGAQEMLLVIAAQGEPARQIEQLYFGMGFSPSRRRLMYRPLD